jgi:hypothetical protein
MMARELAADLRCIVDLRRATRSLPPIERERIGRVAAVLRARVGSAVSKAVAAELLGVTVQALDRRIKAGDIAPAARLTSSRQAVDAESLLRIAEVAADLRERDPAGTSRVVSGAARRLEREGRLSRVRAVNSPAGELRASYESTTGVDRVAEVATLSEALSIIAAAGREWERQPR